MSGLGTVYDLKGADAARDFYDDWAKGYDSELAENGYVTPDRCAQALAAHADSLIGAVADFGCGTGLSGVALRKAGFSEIHGFDISPEMLAQADAKNIYQSLDTIDLSRPIDDVPDEGFQHAAAIGVVNPSFMPPTVIDQFLAKIMAGGCLVFSINDNAARDRALETRILELCEHNVADLVFKEYGEHVPGIGLESTVYVLKKR